MSDYYGNFIIPATLASPTDYATWTATTSPANIVQVLRSCSSIVLDATEGAYYTVDPATGLATNDQVKIAMRDATCIQAAAWVALNIDPATGGAMTAGGVKASKKIGSGAVTYADADSSAAVAARQAAYISLVPDAARKLQQNNLIGTEPYARG